MFNLNRVGIVVACVLFLAPGAAAQNLSRYREFEFGMGVGAVAKQTQSEATKARTVQTKPNLIQSLQWDRSSYFSSSSGTDPVRSIRFEFYDDQLFKILVSYAGPQVEGLTADDLIDGISKVYGPASKPDESIVVSASAGYEDRQKVLARWENSENIYSFFRSSYAGEFGLLAASKGLETLAIGSIQEAQRLETLAAPQREAERRQKEAADRKVSEEKARAVNKPGFRP
jgi:hypothetical protein